MENLRLPAYPLPIAQNQAAEIVDSSEWNGNVGFTKLELASLMIAQGIMDKDDWNIGEMEKSKEIALKIAVTSNLIAKVVLEQANQ